jgi:hypothetical protein
MDMRIDDLVPAKPEAPPRERVGFTTEVVGWLSSAQRAAVERAFRRLVEGQLDRNVFPVAMRHVISFRKPTVLWRFLIDAAPNPRSRYFWDAQVMFVPGEIRALTTRCLVHVTADRSCERLACVAPGLFMGPVDYPRVKMPLGKALREARYSATLVRVV